MIQSRHTAPKKYKQLGLPRLTVPYGEDGFHSWPHSVLQCQTPFLDHAMLLEVGLD